MDLFYQILNFLGIRLNDDSNPFVLFVCFIIILSIVVVSCLFNVLIYFLVVYVLEDLKMLDKYSDKLSIFVLTIIKLYKNTRKIFVVYEVCATLTAHAPRLRHRMLSEALLYLYASFLRQAA